MAQSVIGALRVVLGMDAGNFTRGIDKASSRYNRFSREVSGVTDKLSAAFIKITAAVAAVRAVTNALSKTVTVTAEFEKGMTNISTLLDTNTESMKTMGNAVLDISRKVPVGLGDLTSGLYDVRSAGIDSSKAIDVLRRSSKLAVSGIGSTGEAVDLVTSALNAFKLEGKEADRVYNIIFKTVKNGKTTISKLAQGFGAVAGTVAKAGIKLDDYSSAVAALTTTGLPAAQAHTQLRAVIAGLTRETTLSKKVFGALGVKTFPELIEKSGSLGEAFKRISDAVGGNDATLIKLLGSVEAYNALVGITGNQNEAYVSTLKSMRDGHDALAEAFAKQNATLDSSMKRFGNTINFIAIKIGEVLAPYIAQLANAAETLTDKFAAMPAATQKAIAKFLVLRALLGPLASLFMKLVEWIRSATDAVLTFAENTGKSLGVVGKALAAMGRNSLVVQGFNMIRGGASGATEEMKKLGEEAKKLTSNPWQTSVEDNGEKKGNGEEEGSTIPIVNMLNNIKKAGSGATSALKATQEAQKQLVEEGVRLATEMKSPQEILAEKAKVLDAALAQNRISAEQFGSAMQRATMVAVNSYANMAGQIAGNLAKAFGNSKAFAIAAAVINTAESVTKTLATYGFTPWGIALAASAAAAGAAQIAAIKSAKKGGGSTSTPSNNTAAAATEQNPRSSQQLVNINLHGETYGREQVRGLISSINDAIDDGAVLRVA